MISLVAHIIDNVINILCFAIIIRVIISWALPAFPQLASNKLVILLNDVTEPFLKPFRRFQIGGPAGALDFSPFIAILVLYLIRVLNVMLFF